jgi:hypothetical protein
MCLKADGRALNLTVKHVQIADLRRLWSWLANTPRNRVRVMRDLVTSAAKQPIKLSDSKYT